eukprot:GEMP01096940.1.p2 GENE.GEMP01096940.1~~GEMP01096940.1.p2  ORF type:complete len:106 (+),score=20.81 GEMP01096940.1:300-617(+)
MHCAKEMRFASIRTGTNATISTVLRMSPARSGNAISVAVVVHVTEAAAGRVVAVEAVEGGDVRYVDSISAVAPATGVTDVDLSTDFFVFCPCAHTHVSSNIIYIL